MKLIVQIPCFNEEQTLPQTIYDIPRQIEGIDIVETLIIDDGCKDNTCKVAKEIGAMATVLHGDVDGIILTGGIANNPMVVEYVKKMVSFIAPVIIYPGEDEMHALAMNGLRVLKGELKPKEYTEENMVKTDLPNHQA